jgi:hypothetical protein
MNKSRSLSILLGPLLLAPLAQAEVVINEIMFQPPYAENTPEPLGEEYIELHNTDGVNPVSLDGWALDSGVGYAFAGTVIPAGGFLIVAADPAEFAIKYPAVTATVVGPWTGRLSNSGEKIRLIDGAGTQIDELTYSDEGDWAVQRRGPLDSGHRGWIWESNADGLGGSLELRNPALTNREGQNWQASALGSETPGAANSAATPDIAPMIREVKHRPAIPTSSDFVQVTARLTDEFFAGLSATVFYRTATLTPGAFSSLPMSDNALHGDGDAGDGVFGATLPAFPNGRVVEFYISASDGVNSRTWPGPTDGSGTQGANALYQVENTPAVSDQGLPVYRLIMTAQEEDEFSSANFDYASNAQMNTTFIAKIGDDTDVRYLAGTRRRGAGSRSRDPRTMRLSLPGDNPWQDTTSLNLNSQFNYLQLFGQKLFAGAQLPSALARPVELFMNSVDQSVTTERLYGAYVHMEPQGGDSVVRQFPDDSGGSLYRKRRPDTGLAYRAGDIGDYQSDGWEKSTNKSEADWSDLDVWLEALNDTSNPNYLANLETVMDIDQWIRWFATLALLANGETNPGTGVDDDYYVYAGRIDRRIKAVPHDLDTILGLGDSSAVTDPQHTIYDMIEDDDVLAVLEPFIRHPEILPRYHRALRDLIDGPFSKASFDALLDNCLRDRVPFGVKNGISSFMDARRAYVLSVVNPNLSVSTTLSVVGGFPQTNSANPTLTGLVNLSEATSVRVNGKMATLDLENGSWSLGSQSLIDVPFLNPGATWKYLDDGSDQGTAWRTVAYDDSGWKTGAAEFGYGDGDETTIILYGPDPDNSQNDGNNKYLTTYFRTVVNITDPTAYQEFLVRLKRDDGAAVFINGTRYVLDNLPDGAAYDDVADSATGSPDESTFFEFTIPTTAFVAGNNTIAVEVHQVAADNADVTFDFALSGLEEPPSGSDILKPGINQVLVEALNSAGQVVETTTMAIWYDDGDTATFSGTLASDTTLTAEGGPYIIDADIVVPVGVTLTIEPGTNLFFSQGALLTIRGRLDAQGLPDCRIQFTVFPGSGDSWDGVVFTNTLQDNRMVELDQVFSTAASHSVDITNSRLLLEKVTWRGTSENILEVSGPQLNVVNCDFPSTNGNEAVHGATLSGSDYFNLIGNVFQTSSGYNDIIDFSGGRRPGPIIYLIGNRFLGGSDDVLDLDGIDAHIEGNLFMNIHTDDPNRPSTSNAIATDGDAHLTIVRNIFDDVDHALLLKNESDAIFENNIVRNASLGAISFREILRPTVAAGSDVTCRGNIFIGNVQTFADPNHLRSGGGTPVITANNNIMPLADHIYGTGNIDLDPAFVNRAGGDYTLLPGSPAIGTGINGVDMGAMIPRGAMVSGEPPALTDQTDATLIVHMPGISGIESGTFVTEYRWRLDGGAWSADTDIAVPISLTGLALGDHQVEVLGKDSAGVWQTVPNASQVWTVTTTLPAVVQINEVMADSSTGLDWVELYNSGSSSFDLSGFILTDDATGLTGLVIPSGTSLPAKGFLRFDLDPLLNFGLDRDGEELFLFSGGSLLDSIPFGSQITDLSISRLGRSATWGLSVPTPLAENVAYGSGDLRLLKINEWVSDSQVVICDDFVEIYNPGINPVALGGLFLTDNPGGQITQYTIPALTFVSGGGFVALNFRMNASSRNVGLYDSALNEIDLVAFTSQVEDTSFARVPDGGSTIQVSPLPTPGASNGSEGGTTNVTNTNLIALDHTWSYHDSGTDLLTAWREVGYDDRTWATGAGLIGYETGSLPAPGLQTVLVNPQSNSPFITTYYFRSEFTYNGDLGVTTLNLGAVIDDGVAVYLNGQEIYRQSLDANPTYSSLATSSPDNATFSGPFVVPAGALVNGVNVLASEVHQTNTGSSDVVFGLTLDASETVFTPANDAAYLSALDLVNNLRITEVMFDPAEGTDFEFIELQNIGSIPLELEGVRFVEGIEFIFPQMTLAPGEFVILVSNQVSFESKYGVGDPVAGQYTGKLSNGGEQLILQLPAPFNANIQKFTYNDSWYPITDGGGSSLEIINPLGRVRDWDDKSAWRSGAFNGTPGSLISLSAGNTQVVVLSNQATLNGSVGGGWSPGLVWTQIDGPAAATINASASEDTPVDFTLPGTYRFQLQGTDGGTVLVSETLVAVDDTYAQWALRNSLVTAPNEDEDGDGIENLCEYAYDLDPKVRDSFSVLALNNGAFEYTRYLRKSDIAYEIEESTSLSGWSGVANTLVSATADTEQHSYILPEGVRWFVRLKITR